MALAEQRAKDARMAKRLVDEGIPHGYRRTSVAPNSGGLTMLWGPGSSKNQRRNGYGPYPGKKRANG